MSTDLVLPVLPFGAAEVMVLRWLRQPGEVLAAGEPLLIAANQQIEVALPAPAAGTLTAILTPEGALARAGAPLARLEPPQRLRISPLARRIAQTLDLPLHTLSGSGPGGRIMRRDLPGANPAPRTTHHAPQADSAATNDYQTRTNGHAVADTPPTAQDEASSPTARSLQRSNAPTLGRSNAPTLQRSVAPTLQRSNAPTLQRSNARSLVSECHALTVVEADLGAVLAWCGRQTKGAGRVAATPLACVAQAAVAALLRFPLLNAAWHDHGIVVRRRVHLELRRGSPDSAPQTIPDAQDLNLRGLARALARPGPTAPPTATFCLAESAGWADAGMPAPGQSARLSLGAIHQRPSVISQSGTERIGARPLALLSLAYDARVLDQPLADAYLAALRQNLEQFSA